MVVSKPRPPSAAAGAAAAITTTHCEIERHTAGSSGRAAVMIKQGGVCSIQNLLHTRTADDDGFLCCSRDRGPRAPRAAGASEEGSLLWLVGGRQRARKPKEATPQHNSLTLCASSR